ncbi:hypothetical protein WJN01_08145 [Flavobacteriaceae bacterium SZ-1-7]|uniref:hypothetical protein n=1 Tax=Tamlana sedimenti TaxID=3134126 RepID=UPI0031270A6D
MIEFLLKHYSFSTYTLEFLAAITGLLCYKKYRNSVAKYFIWFLLLVAISDTLCFYTFFVNPNRALYFLIGTKVEKNHWWSTLYWDVGAIVFLCFFYYKILKTVLFQNIVKVAGYSFLFFSALYIGLNWEQFFFQFFEVFDLLGAAIVFMCSMFYFMEILTSDKILVFYKSIYFYITVTIFIWWLIITPLTFYDVYNTYEVGKPPNDLNFRKLRRLVYLSANIFMYLTYTFSFLWCRPEND